MVEKSTHRVEIVSVRMEKHPNADTLSIIPVFGYTYVGRTADWVGVERAAYVPPDSVVDTRRPEFSFLAEQARADGTVRIKARRLRGIVSYGLLVPVPNDTPLGEDWAERLGVSHYEPPLEHEKGKGALFLGGEAAPAPAVVTIKYDVDAFRRYHHLFVPGEPVIVTEKLDGANARYVFSDGKMHCGSRTEWKKEYPSYEHVTVDYLAGRGLPREQAVEVVEKLHDKPRQRNLWWGLLRQTPALEKFCQDHPGLVVYGEVFGDVNCIKYGLPEGNRFAAFDVMRDGCFLDFQEMSDLLHRWSVPMVPSLHTWKLLFPPIVEPIAYDFETICCLAEGPTRVPGARAGAIREGVVVKPLHERSDAKIGRVCLKVINPTFLEKYR